MKGRLAGLWGGLALTSGVALTATSGWLIVRASERPVILTLLTAIVGVRAFGMARPFFRHLERLRSHDTALGDLAEARTRVYAALVPLTPARLGRRSRSAVLTGVVEDLTDVVEAHVRVRGPVLSAVVAAASTTLLTVLATAVPTKKYARKLKKAEKPTATLGGIARVATTVATELAAS